jgi:hypothetical protein
MGYIGRGLWPGNEIPVVTPGTSADLIIQITQFEDEGAHTFNSKTTTLSVNYKDLAGREFTTTFGWSFLRADQPSNVGEYLRISSGVMPQEREGPSIGRDDYTNPLGAARRRHWPTRRAIGYAWRTYLVQRPDEVPLPFHTRLHSAWRELFPTRRAQRFQRIAWSFRVYRATLEMPIPRVPGYVLGPGLYRIARGWKWAWLTYFRMR